MTKVYYESHLLSKKEMSMNSIREIVAKGFEDLKIYVLKEGFGRRNSRNSWGVLSREEIGRNKLRQVQISLGYDPIGYGHWTEGPTKVTNGDGTIYYRYIINCYGSCE